MRTEGHDFLIIGGGVAGLRAAIELAARGSVLVIMKDALRESSSDYAQGGVAVALSDEDEVGIHYEDTLKAGDGLCREEAVRVLVEEGPERIRELISWGAEFDKEGSRLSFSLEAAHSRKRILHAHGDSTGRELVRALTAKVRTFDTIKVYTYSTALDLIVHDGRCLGAYVQKDREVLAVLAGATLLATGGAGQIYSITTNPKVATADGVGIAWRAGAVLEDMEFVQFHPTSLFHPLAQHFLLSEALRGEGGALLNIKGEAFMKRYHGDAELAPRDIVSRAIISEMVRTKSRHVYLDLRHMGAGFVRKRFPKIYSTCLEFDIDITRDLIPVSPAAHYMMGGVRTGLEGGTTLGGLYAAGEVSCTGVHGANRLASNSLLEGLVFGERAGKAMASGISKTGGGPPEGWRPDYPVSTSYSIPDHDEMRGELRRLMWEKVGIIRCNESLSSAREVMSAWLHILEKPYFTRREVELRNMLGAAVLITEAALMRKGSVGAHFRSDAPDRGDDWQRHITFVKSKKGPLSFQADKN